MPASSRSADHVNAFLAGKNAVAVDLFRRFQELVDACGSAEAVVRKTAVYWRRTRIFAGGFVNGRRLEIVLDLLREVEHPCLLGRFASTKKVWSHRLRISDAGQLDESIAALIREAYEEVGRGTR